MSMEIEILRSFDNNYELLRYTTNTIKNWKIEIKSIFNPYAFCFNAYSFFVEGGRGRGGLLERRGLLKNSTSRRGAY